MDGRMGDNRITTFSKKFIIGVFTAGIISIVVILVLGVIYIDFASVFNLVLLAGLIVVTMFYVYYTMKIADAARIQAEITRQQSEATRQQADASVRMAEEMSEQRIVESRPVIIQKAIPTEAIGRGFSDRFEVYNAGNGPAIELEIFLLDKEENLIQKQRVTFLRASDTPVEFYPSGLDSRLNSDCYLLCRYQSILSFGAKPSWYVTRLPFKPVKSQSRDYIYVEPGKLEFEEVFEKKSY